MNDIGPHATRVATDNDLAACANEPIHTPGAIQPHGVLVAAYGDDLKVSHASANLQSVTGIPVAAAIGGRLSDILGGETYRNLQNILATERYSPLSLSQQSLNSSGPKKYNLRCHRSNERLIVEIEEGDPLDTPETALVLAQSVLASLRRKLSLHELCDHVAHEIRRLTGYDRVMVYRFDQAGNGQVIAEDRVPEIEPFIGLHYPASDIPAQARRLYLLQRIRVVPLIDHQPVPILVDPALPPSDLDMSHCMLRAVSPIHLEYMRNMGVGATLAISITHEQDLWGMIVCHHRTYLKPAIWINALCDLIGQLFSLLVGEVSERERLSLQVERQKRLSVITSHLEYRPSIIDGLDTQAENLLRLVDATGVYICLGGKTLTLGRLPPEQSCRDILRTLRPPVTGAIVALENLDEQFPDFRPFRDCATGVLVLPIGTNHDEGLVWFRPEIVSTVDWGGDPLNKAQVEVGTQRISPRKSFDAWREIVSGQATKWSKIDLRAARDFRRMLTRALLRHSEAELFRVSNSDPLTGLSNRRVLNQRLDAWRAAEPQRTAVLLFLDLDRFKMVNDSLGHFAGDDLLHETARRLSMLGTDRHLIARLGGDEFVVFRENLSDAEAEQLAQDVLRLFDEPFGVFGRPYKATTSIGIAYASTAADDLMREADSAMYVAKRLGGNRAVRFQKSMHDAVGHRLRMEQDLFMALERGEITVHYQPCVTLPGGTVYAYEALARWNHPELGAIAPLDFILLAEETNQIERLGSWIAHEAIRQLAALSDPALKMTINVSAHQLRLDSIVHDISEALARHQVAPERIVIEVTESALMDDAAVRSLRELRSLGCGVAVDDFGTGYSSLAYLQRLPLTMIKIDRSFVTPLGTDSKAEYFISAMTNLAHALGIHVIAEGVETELQREILTRVRCDAAQGYLFGKPKPMDGQDGANPIGANLTRPAPA